MRSYGVCMPKTTAVTERDIEQFRSEGYFVLENVIPDEHLTILRDSLDMFIERIDRQMEEAGVETHGLNHKGKRYFIANQYHSSERMHEFLFSDLAAEICRA